MQDKELFYKYPEKLMKATGYIQPVTGELIELSASDKNVYLIMKKRNSFFDKHFDKQEDIAELCGIGVKQVGRILRSFIENKVIEANKGIKDQHKNWRYSKVLAVEFYRKTKGGTDVLGSIPEGFWKSEKKAQKPVDKAQWIDEDDDQGPF